MSDIFLSYARENARPAKQLANALVELRGWSVWWDTSLRIGEQYPRRIQEAVSGARCVVVLWSRHSTDSNWVIAEASEGWNRGILVPVLLDGTEPPMPFRQTQARDLSGWNGSLRDATLLAFLEDVQRVHARGNAATVDEIAAREARRHAFVRRRNSKRIGTAAVFALVVGLSGYAWHAYDEQRSRRAAAESLSQRADELRQKVLALTPEQTDRKWWATLEYDEDRYHELQLSVLLATEAWCKAKTARTERSLRDVLALLPSSDRCLELDVGDGPTALAFGPKGDLLAAGGSPQETIVWDVDGDAVIARIAHGGTGGATEWKDPRGTFRGGRGSRHVLAFHPVREEIATAGPDDTARIWEARTGRELQKLPHDSVATAVEFDLAGKFLATSSVRGVISLWDAQSGELVRSMQHGAPVFWIDFSPSSTYLASVGLDHAVAIWRVADARRLHRFDLPPAVDGVRFDPDEKRVVTFGSDVDTTLWDLESGAEVWRLVGIHSDGDAGVIFDRATRTMIVGEASGSISWWDITDRLQRFSISSGHDDVLAMAASADHRFLITLGDDSEARAWDFATGRLLKRMPYRNWLMAVAMSPDGQRFAATGENGSTPVIDVMQIWPADPAAAACAHVGRNLTREEWHEYLGDEPYRLTCPDVSKK